MIHLTRTTSTALALAVLTSTGGCGDREPEGSGGRSLLVPSHDLVMTMLRSCELTDARAIAEETAATLDAPEAREKLLTHVEALMEMTRIGGVSVTGGPLADGCIRLFFGPPYRDQAPSEPWRPPGRIAAIADTLAGLERAGTSLEPQKPPSVDPRYTYELATHLANLDQYARVEALLAALPESEHGSFWYRFIRAITSVRSAVNADWQDYGACRAAVDTLNVLYEVAERDEALAAHSVVVLFDLAMIERHMRRHRQAVEYLNRALTHPVGRGPFREFLSQTWTRF